MFVDEVSVSLKAGDGGNGCVSFRRAKYEPKGGPNGGNGGRGGNIVLVCDENTSDLTDYRFVPHATAKNGEPGRGSDQHGAGGADKELKLPMGTVVLQKETGRVVTELLEHGQKIVLLKGGKGGLGNLVFKSSVNQAPRKTTPGTPGEEGEYKCVLKTIADVGLVGFPNAGKSTFVSMLSNATPKAGPYPFTTLHPSVGVVDYGDMYDRITLADVPGLIEGASENRGLGHRFLRHIERCKLLVFLLDMAAVDQRDPLEDFEQLRKELEAYDPKLLEQPYVVVGNKIDEAESAENIKRFRKRFPQHPLHLLSCLSDEGMPELKLTLLERVREIRKAEAAAKAEADS